MNKFFSIFFALFLILGLVFSDIADAKSRGGSFSSFKSSSSIFKSSKPKSTLKASSTTQNPKSGSFGKTAPTVKNSYKYEKQGNPVKSSSPAKTYKPKTPDSFRYYSNPPAYVYQTYPTFGIWDTIF